MTTTMTTNPSEKALIARINRQLAYKNEVLRKARGERARQELGRYYVLDLNLNCIVAHHIEDLEAFLAE